MMETTKMGESFNLDSDLMDFRNASKCHILKIECNMTEDDKRHTFHMAENLRRYSNLINNKARKRLDQVFRRKKYKEALAVYQETENSSEPEDINRKKVAVKQMKEIWELEGLTLTGLYEACKPMAAHLNIPSPFARNIAKEVFQVVESIIHGEDRKLRFRERFDFPLIQDENVNSAITSRVVNGEIIFKTDFTKDFELIVKEKDNFMQEEYAKAVEFLTNPDIEREAVKKYKETGELTDTFRICYVTLKCEKIRRKLRVFALLTLEGNPLPKKNKNEEQNTEN